MVRVITCAVYIDSDDEHKDEKELHLILIKHGMMARIFDNVPVNLIGSFKEQFAHYKKIYKGKS